MKRRIYIVCDKRGQGMEIIDICNIADDRSAVLELQFSVASAHARRIALVAIRHGEGKRSVLARRFLRKYKKTNPDVALLFGEELSGEGSVARYFLDRYPVLAEETPAPDTTYLAFLLK